MPHLESKTKLIMTASVNKYINPVFYNFCFQHFIVFLHPQIHCKDNAIFPNNKIFLRKSVIFARFWQFYEKHTPFIPTETTLFYFIPAQTHTNPQRCVGLLYLCTVLEIKRL